MVGLDTTLSKELQLDSQIEQPEEQAPMQQRGVEEEQPADGD